MECIIYILIGGVLGAILACFIYFSDNNSSDDYYKSKGGGRA